MWLKCSDAFMVFSPLPFVALRTRNIYFLAPQIQAEGKLGSASGFGRLGRDGQKKRRTPIRERHQPISKSGLQSLLQVEFSISVLITDIEDQMCSTLH